MTTLGLQKIIKKLGSSGLSIIELLVVICPFRPEMVVNIYNANFFQKRANNTINLLPSWPSSRSQ